MSIELRGANAVMYECRDAEVLLEARAGSGKTVAACKKVYDAALQYPGSQHLLCRQTRKSMTDSTLVTFESVVGDRHPEVTRVGRDGRHSYRFGGSEIVCAGLDEPAKAFGTAWGLILIEEAVETSLDALELFSRAARDPKLRREGGSAPFPYHQVIAVTNPSNPRHHLNLRATPAPDNLRRVETKADWKRLDEFNSGPQAGKMRRIIGVHQDNPLFFDLDGWAWTAEGAAYIDRLGRMSGHNRDRMLYGLWVAAAGSVFGSQFIDSRNVVGDYAVPADWPTWFFLDPGYDHPCGAFWVTATPTGRRVIVDELYVRQTPINDDPETGTVGIASLIRQRERDKGYRPVGRYLDPRMGFSKTAYSNGKTIQERFQEEGFEFDPWPALAMASKDAAVDTMRTMLTKGSLRTMARCANFRMECQSWSYKRNTSGEQLQGDDQYEDRNNHLIDGALGMVTMDLAVPPEIPIEIPGYERETGPVDEREREEQ